MAENQKPKTINKSSDKQRKINISVDVKKLIKEWFVSGQKSTYMNLTLNLMPDGEVDNYGNLGYVVQTPPKSIKEEHSKMTKEERPRWPIVGNGVEYEYKPIGESVEDIQNAPAASSSDFDDLPF